MSAPDTAALLSQYRPVVQYDSLESYYTDWAAVISDCPGNVLKRADGTVLAVAGPSSGGIPQLTLDFLQPETYPSGEAVAATDYIAEIGPSYVSEARRMHALPGYANRVHGRVVEQAGVTWLQYWFFMYYDDPGFLGLGTHQGDLEMIQLRLGASGQPDAVSYAQHRSGVSAAWDEVERENSAPVVYSARGTHASMLRAGDLVISDRSLIPDHNDAKGPRVQLDLIPLSEAQTPWAFWPGHWGGTKPEDQLLGKVGVEANSPTALGQHSAWKDPAAFHAQCEAADLPPIGEAHVSELPAPAPPTLEVQRDATAGVVKVNYDIPPGPAGAPPASMVIGVQSEDGLPPATTVVHLAGESGELAAPLGSDTGSVTVSATVHADTGVASPTTAVTAS